MAVRDSFRGVAFAGLVWAFLLTSRTSAGQAGQQSQSTPPSFHASSELLTIDVQIAPARNAPLRQFLPKEFSVRVSGHDRTAVSATRMHDDTGPVTREVPRSASPECPFDFRRTVDRPTVHYVLAFDLTESDRKRISRVAVRIADKMFTVQRYGWRTIVP